MVTESSTPIAHRSMEPFETPPVGLAYATPGHQVTPPKRMLAAVVALAVGLLLLLLASFILLRLVSLLMVGAWGDREIFLALASVFGGFCTIIGDLSLRRPQMARRIVRAGG